jgi:hypothetical protein
MQLAELVHLQCILYPGGASQASDCQFCCEDVSHPAQNKLISQYVFNLAKVDQNYDQGQVNQGNHVELLSLRVSQARYLSILKRLTTKTMPSLHGWMAGAEEYLGKYPGFLTF